MRVLDVGHGGSPSPVLLKEPYTHYVGTDSGVMQAALRARGYDVDILLDFQNLIEHLQRTDRGVKLPDIELYGNDIVEFSRLWRGDRFDVVYMGNVLGDPDNKKRSAGNNIVRWASILGSSASMLSGQQAYIWVVEAFTPPEFSQVKEAGEINGLTPRNIIEGEDFWKRHAGLTVHGKCLREHVELAAIEHGYGEVSPFMVEFTKE